MQSSPQLPQRPTNTRAQQAEHAIDYFDLIRSAMHSNSLSLLTHVVALISIYSLYSILQEKILKTTYGKLRLCIKKLR